LLGTQSSEIFEIRIDNQENPLTICLGHAEGELWALAVSPSNPEIFATASDDKTVRIWNMMTNQLISNKKLDKRIRSCSFSSDR
jgi:WD40 repeat protein